MYIYIGIDRYRESDRERKRDTDKKTVYRYRGTKRHKDMFESDFSFLSLSDSLSLLIYI